MVHLGLAGDLMLGRMVAERLDGLQAAVPGSAKHVTSPRQSLLTGAGSAREQEMNVPGFTHISVSVEDVATVCWRVPELGGVVVADSNNGFAVFTWDLDGQPVELLPISNRDDPDGPR